MSDMQARISDVDAAFAKARGLTELEHEMLEALKGVVAVADRATVEFDKARAAIVKAESTAAPVEPKP